MVFVVTNLEPITFWKFWFGGELQFGIGKMVVSDACNNYFFVLYHARAETQQYRIFLITKLLTSLVANRLVTFDSFFS